MKINVLVIEFGIKSIDQLKRVVSNKVQSNKNFFFASSFLDVVDKLYLGKIHIIVFSNFRGVQSTIGYIKMFKKTDSSFRLIIIDNNNSPKEHENLILIQSGADKIVSYTNTDELIDFVDILYNEITTNESIAHWRESTIKFVNYFRQNYQEKYNIIEKLSNATGYSASAIQHYVKEDTGKSPNEWIIELRIKGAIQLIKSTNLPLKDISSLVGYNTTQGLLKAFKKITGTTPKDYLKNN